MAMDMEEPEQNSIYHGMQWALANQAKRKHIKRE